MPPWVALGFGLSVAGALVLLFPGRGADPWAQAPPGAVDPLHAAVLRALGQAPPPAAAPARTVASALPAPAGDEAQQARAAFAAQDRAAGLAAARAAYAEALRHLLATGDVRRALEQALAHLGRLHEDPATLERLARLARSADRPELAQDLALRAARGAGTTDERLARLALAYDASLAVARLDDAVTMAQAALRLAPQDAWRLRLAQAASWSNRPALALAQWQALARAHGADDAAWREVALRARALRDGPALLEALERRWGAGRADAPAAAPLARELELAYEEQGEVGRAERLLQEQIARNPPAGRAALLRRLADLAQRAGDEALAAATLTRLLDARPGDARLALELARLQARRGDAPGAAARVAANLDPAQERDPEALRDGARLLREGGRLDAALALLLRRIALGQAGPGERLEAIELQERHDPQAATALALALFAQAPDADLAQRALGLLERDGNVARLRAFLHGFTPAREAAVAGNPYFLVQRAQLRLRLGETGAALRDAQRALALRPRDPQLRAAWLWTLIGAQAEAPLRARLAQWAPLLGAGARTPPGLADALVAGLLAVHEPRLALPFLQRRAAHADQAPWWLAYADALEQDGQPELARRAQQRALALLRRAQVRAGATHELAGTAQAAAAATALERLELALVYVPGDAARARLHALAASLRAARVPGRLAPEGELERSALVLASLVAEEPDTLGQAWLLAHAVAAAGPDPAPGWARLPVALAQDDRAELAGLLDAQAGWLPPAEAIEAAQRLGRGAQAQTLAFEQMLRTPDDDRLAPMLAQALTPPALPLPATQAAYADAGLRTFTQQPLREFAQWLAASVPLSQHLALGLQAEQARRASEDAAQLVAPAGADRRLAASLRAQATPEQAWQLDLEQRQGLQHANGAALRWQQDLGQGLALDARAGWHQDTVDSIYLRIGGLRNGLEATAQQRWSATDSVALSAQAHEYRSQSGARLGGGQVLRVDAEHGLRLAYPDVAAYGGAAALRFAAQPGLDPLLAGLLPPAQRASAGNAVFLGQDTNQLEFGLRLGESARSQATRALRPYASFGLLHDSVSGYAPQWDLGVAGSVLGGDTLTLGLRGGSALGNSQSAPQREWKLAYRWYF